MRKLTKPPRRRKRKALTSTSECSFDVSQRSAKAMRSSISSNTAESTSPKESREESPATRPKYSSKRPSQLAGLLGQDGMKSGVDTPDRFFFPQKAHPGGPLSPKAFTSALNRGLTKLSGREQLNETSKREPQGKGVDKGGQHDDISELSLLPSAADDGDSSGRHGEDEERPDLGTPKPVQRLTPGADSPDAGEDRGGSDHVGHRTKAFAFYGQVSRDATFANATCIFNVVSPNRMNQTRRATKIHSIRIIRISSFRAPTILVVTGFHTGSRRIVSGREERGSEKSNAWGEVAQSTMLP